MQHAGPGGIFNLRVVPGATRTAAEAFITDNFNMALRLKEHVMRLRPCAHVAEQQ